MTNPPSRTRTRRTTGSKTLGDFVDRHGLEPVAVYIPEPLHRALSTIAVETETPMQAMFTLACNKYYGHHADLPPLTAPTYPKQDPHKNYTWYADVDLHKRMKLLAIDIGSNVQQLIMSAVVDYMKDAPKVKKLRIKTGYPAFKRAPAVPPRLPRRSLDLATG